MAIFLTWTRVSRGCRNSWGFGGSRGGLASCTGWRATFRRCGTWRRVCCATWCWRARKAALPAKSWAAGWDWGPAAQPAAVAPASPRRCLEIRQKSAVLKYHTESVTTHSAMTTRTRAKKKCLFSFARAHTEWRLSVS